MIWFWLQTLLDHFLAPHVLAWAALAGFLLVLWRWEERRRQTALALWDGDAATHAGKRPRAAVLALVLLLALSAAQPWWGRSPLRPETDDRRILILLDVSRSMLAEDRDGKSRLARAQFVVLQWLDAIEGRRGMPRVGLVAFAGQARLLMPPTTDYGPLRVRLLQANAELLGRRLRLGAAAGGEMVGTSYGPALKLAKTCLPKEGQSGTPPIVLLVTDGDDVAGDGPAQASELAGVAELHILGMGRSDVASPIPTGDAEIPFLMHAPPGDMPRRVETRRRDDVLASMAQAAGGTWTTEERVPKPLVNWWQEKLASPAGRRWEEVRQPPIPRYHWFLAPAWLILFVELRLYYSRPPARPKPRRPWAPGVLSLALGLGLTLLAGADAGLSALARTYAAYQRGDYVAALQAAQAAQAETTDPGRLAYHQAACWYALGKYDEAVTSYRQCLEDAVGARRTAALLGLGNAYAQSGATTPGSLGVSRLRSALLAYDQALKEGPRDSELRANLIHNRQVVLETLNQRPEEPLDDAPPPPESPPPAPNTESPSAEGSGERSEGEPAGAAPRRPGRGSLPVLLDEAGVGPLTAEQARLLLEENLERIAQQRRGTSLAPVVKERDW